MNLNRILGTAGGAVLTVGLVAVGPAGATSGPSASIKHDTLVVSGRGGADRIVLRFAPGPPVTVGVDLDADGTADETFDLGGFTKIRVQGGGGDDQITVDDAGNLGGTEAITIDGGSGDDTLLGGSGNESFVGGSGDDQVDGNRGTDTAALGSGQDTFTWDPGDGNDTIDGDSGRDTLDFNGANAAEVMRLFAEGRRAVFVRDVANIRMDMDDVERLDVDALGGADTVTVADMSGTDFRTADVDLAATGGAPDGAVDTVIAEGTAGGDEIDLEPEGSVVEVQGLRVETRLVGGDTSDRIQVNALGGDDDVDIDSRVLTLFQVAVDLGSGQA